MAVNLTEARIRTLQPAAPGRRFEVRDALVPGLLVRVTATGHKSFMLMARYPGASPHAARRLIGKFGKVSLAEARDTARAWLALIHKGLDPAHEIRERKRLAELQREDEQRRRAQDDAATFAAVAEDYFKRVLPKLRTGRRIERDIRRDILPEWGARPIAEITRADVRELIEKIAARSRNQSGAYARNCYGHGKALFNWAINRDSYALEASPFDRLRSRQLLGEKRPRERVLTDDELQALWRAADRLGYPFGPLFQLLALCGQRKSDVGNARWREFDRRAREWVIPATRFKSSTRHTVPLTDDMLALLDALPRFRHGDYLFSTVFGAKPPKGFSRAKERLDRLMLEELRAPRDGLEHKDGSQLMGATASAQTATIAEKIASDPISTSASTTPRAISPSCLAVDP